MNYSVKIIMISDHRWTLVSYSSVSDLGKTNSVIVLVVALYQICTKRRVSCCLVFIIYSLVLSYLSLINMLHFDNNQQAGNNAATQHAKSTNKNYDDLIYYDILATNYTKTTSNII